MSTEPKMPPMRTPTEIYAAFDASMMAWPFAIAIVQLGQSMAIYEGKRRAAEQRMKWAKEDAEMWNKLLGIKATP